MEDPILFVVAALTVLGVPGPTNALLAIAGATVTLQRAPLLVAAVTGAYALAIPTLHHLLGPAVAAMPKLAMTLRMLAGTYLLALAFRLWRRGTAPSGQAGEVGPAQLFVTTLLNPKSIVLTFGVLPVTSHSVAFYFLGILVMAALVATVWVLTGAALGRAALERQRSNLVPRLGAAVVAGFGVLLLATPLSS